MKTLIILSFIFIIAISANAQKLKESEVPSAVKLSFTKMFPDAKKVKWEKENNTYEAEIRDNHTETSASFDAAGNYLQTETEISVSSLPSNVKDYAAKNFPDSKIKEASKIISADGSLTYE